MNGATFLEWTHLLQGKIAIKPDTKKVNEEEYIKYSKPIDDRTILLSINGTIGNLAYYNNEKCVLGKSACYINLNDKVDKQFIYYHFLNREFQAYIIEVATGTTIPNVPLKGIREYSFKLPELPEQKAIAEVLSGLDDKIDLLHRQNKTLEQMAETLFRQWFVEKAKEDWEEVELSKIAQFKNGKSRPKEEGNFPIYGGNGILGYAKEYNAEDESIIIGRVGAYCGSLYFENQKIWISDNAILCKAKIDIYLYFIFYFLKNMNLNNLAEGSSHPLLTQTLLNKIELQLPPNNILEQFNIQIENFFRKK